jgi:broad specificity phosphatase PhoE
MTLPETLWLVRHGESVANVARQKADAENLGTIDFPYREQDVPLSEKGTQQAAMIGGWFAALPDNKEPTQIYASPFVRTTQTASILSEAARYDATRVLFDERLRERELGIFDRLTKAGAMIKYPEECERREAMGKYYHRPPGGESWADVTLRLRNFWHDVQMNQKSERILIVTHEVVIRCFRAMFERLNETDLMAIDSASDIFNGAVTEYEFESASGFLKLMRDNFLPQS